MEEIKEDLVEIEEVATDAQAPAEVDSMGLSEYLAFKGVQAGEVYKSKNPFGERGANERIVSTGEELRRKEFCIGIWNHMQVNSKSNQIDDFRYISKDGLISRIIEVTS